jgi:hypothetical protein
MFKYNTIQYKKSTYVPVESGVSKWYVLGPSIFLYKINDTPVDLGCTIQVTTILRRHHRKHGYKMHY